MCARLLRPAPGRGERGFTYIEAVMTVLVIGVMVGLSVPWLIPRYRAYQLRSAAWQIAGDLRLARQRAVTTRVCHRFAFRDGAAGANPNTYVIQYAATPPCAQPWLQESPPDPAVRLRLAGPIQIDPSSKPSGRTLLFNPNGSVVPSGTIQLTGSDGIGLAVTVDQVGRVKVNSP